MRKGIRLDDSCLSCLKEVFRSSTYDSAGTSLAFLTAGEAGTCSLSHLNILPLVTLTFYPQVIREEMSIR